MRPCDFVFRLSILFTMSVVVAADTAQTVLEMDSWRVELSATWNVLGPFPIQAREQQFLSPSFPLNLSDPIDYHKTWPSSYADGGRVSWSTTTSDNGNLQVSFPNIRWETLRATEGWAAMQHHAVLGTTLTLQPPSNARSIPHLLVQLLQGSYFTILPTSLNATRVPRWYAGNIYAMERGLPQVVTLPDTPSLELPTVYDLFVSGDYEIRLFGDPHSQGGVVPVQNISFLIEAEGNEHRFVHESTQDVVCNFVDGFAFGDAFGVGIRGISGSWTVTSVTSRSEGLDLTLPRPIKIVDGQTRIIPIILSQGRSFSEQLIEMDLELTSPSASTKVLFISLTVLHLDLWTVEAYKPIMASYFYAKSMPTLFTVIPPMHKSSDQPKPPILALHGAGVDIVEHTFWAESLPRNPHSWLVLPSGRTSWGLDWHGSSAKDAWLALDALTMILDRQSIFHSYKIPLGMPVVLIGHSNGGQGAWYIASRYPDRIVAVVPAAAYIKSQSYVPLPMSRSARFTDPALMSILESSLTPDNNDLFLSNLVDTPILAVHGGNDDNVPVWHSREAVSIVQTWNPAANVSLREDPGKKHWYPAVLNNAQVNEFVDSVISAHPRPYGLEEKFTLTVSIPSESGSLHGWGIQSLTIPGRLGRLSVQRLKDDEVRITTTNIEGLSVDTNFFPVSKLHIDDTPIRLKEDEDGVIYFEAVHKKVWKIIDQHKENVVQASGRMQSVLASNGPLVIVVPDENHEDEMSVALRIAHDLEVYHRLDSEIIHSSEALSNDLLSQGNVVVVGNEASLAFKPQNLVPERYLDGPGIGLIFLHSHPSNAKGNMVMLQSTDHEGLERAVRLFPIRTGIAVPDWLIIGPLADTRGAGGVLSAGVWGNDWSWSNEMSWTS